MTASKGQIRTRDNLFRPRSAGVLSRLAWLERRDPIEVHCHTCKVAMVIESKPAEIVGTFGIKKTFYPCPAAPYICALCRSEKKKLLASRDAMDEHFHSCREKNNEATQVGAQTITQQRAGDRLVG